MATQATDSSQPDRIRFKCPQCGSKMKAPASDASRRRKCPVCQTKVIVPQPGNDPEQPAQLAPPREKKRGSSQPQASPTAQPTALPPQEEPSSQVVEATPAVQAQQPVHPQPAPQESAPVAQQPPQSAQAPPQMMAFALRSQPQNPQQIETVVQHAIHYLSYLDSQCPPQAKNAFRGYLVGVSPSMQVTIGVCYGASADEDEALRSWLHTYYLPQCGFYAQPYDLQLHDAFSSVQVVRGEISQLWMEQMYR